MEQFVQRYLYGPPPEVVYVPKVVSRKDFEFCTCAICAASPATLVHSKALLGEDLGSAIFAINLLNSRGP